MTSYEQVLVVNLKPPSPLQEATRFAEAIGALSEGKPPALAPRVLADMGASAWAANDARNND